MSIMQKIDEKQQMIIVDCDNVDESEANISHLIGAGYKVAGTHYAWIPEYEASAYVVYMVLGDDMLRAELAAEREMSKKDVLILRQSQACVEGWIEEPLSTYSLLAMENLLGVLQKHLAQTE